MWVVIDHAKVGHCNNNKQGVTIYCNPSYGPSFNNNDLHCRDGNWYSHHPVYYSKVDILQRGHVNLNVDDYEVFQVVKM